MFEVILYDLRGQPTRELIAFSLLNACAFAFYSGQDYTIRKLENLEVYIEQKDFVLTATEKAKYRLLKELIRVNKQFLNKECGFTALREITNIMDDLVKTIK